MPNRHQPKKKPINVCRGGGGVGWCGGLYGRPLMGFLFPSVIRRWNKGYAGGHKGPPYPSQPPPPLRNPGPTSSVDAYWQSLAVALWVGRPYASRPLRWYFLPGLVNALHLFTGRLRAAW